MQELRVFYACLLGVVGSGGKVLHFGTLLQYILGLVMERLVWAKTSKVNIIGSCVCQYKLELICRFVNGKLQKLMVSYL